MLQSDGRGRRSCSIAKVTMATKVTVAAPIFRCLQYAQIPNTAFQTKIKGETANQLGL